MPVKRSYGDLTLNVADGGRLLPDLPPSRIGPGNYAEKINFRRDDSGELKIEGWDYPAPTSDWFGDGLADFNDGLEAEAIKQVRRANGTVAIVGCGAGFIKYFDYDLNQWITIGSGYSTAADEGFRFWKIEDVANYVVFNNGRDLLCTWQIGDDAVVPLYEFREAGYASCGDICGFNSVLRCADILEINDASQAAVMNSANPYRTITDSDITTRINYRRVWSNVENPRDFGAVIPGTITTGSDQLVLAWPAASLAAGDFIYVTGAGVEGGNLLAEILSISGATITLGETASTDATDTEVFKEAALETIVGYDDLGDDGAAIIQQMVLKNRLVSLKASGHVFEEYYNGDLEQPFIAEQMTKTPRALRFPRALANVADRYLLFPGDRHFYRYHLGSQELEQDKVLFGAEKTLFFKRIEGSGIYDVWAADNICTGEILFAYHWSEVVDDDGEAEPASVASDCQSKTGIGELIGWEELTSPSSPPEKYRHRTVSGSIAKYSYYFDNCYSEYPPEDELHYVGTLADAPGSDWTVNLVCVAIAESETTVTYRVTWDGTGATGHPSTPRLTVSPGGTYLPNPYEFEATKGYQVYLEVQFNYIYWHGQGFWIFVGPPPKTDNWNSVENYTPMGEFSSSISATRTQAGLGTFDLADFTELAGFVAAGQPQFCYDPWVSSTYGALEPVFTGITELTQTRRTTSGLGCVANANTFGARSVQATGDIVEELSDPDTEADAVARALVNIPNWTADATCDDPAYIEYSDENFQVPFSFRQVRAILGVESPLTIGNSYRVTFSFERRTLGTEDVYVAIDANEAITFTANAATKTTEFVDVPNELGYETRLADITLEQIAEGEVATDSYGGDSYGSNRALAVKYDEGNESCAEIDEFRFTCAATVNKPTAGTSCDEIEQWFLMGDRLGKITQFGRSNLEVFTLLRYGETFAASLSGGLVTAGKDTQPKYVRRFSLLPSDPDSSASVEVSIYGAKTTNVDPVLLESKTLTNPQFPGVMNLHYRKPYFKYRLTSDASTPLRISAHVWEIALADTGDIDRLQ